MMAARLGMGRRRAARGDRGRVGEPGRARLKLMHQAVHKVLSARLFFGASCRDMWCTELFPGPGFSHAFGCMGQARRHG